MLCLSCWKEIPDGSLFCKYCGAKQEKKCPKCGALLDDDSVFCMQCGERIIPCLSEAEAQANIEAWAKLGSSDDNTSKSGEPGSFDSTKSWTAWAYEDSNSNSAEITDNSYDSDFGGFGDFGNDDFGDFSFEKDDTNKSDNVPDEESFNNMFSQLDPVMEHSEYYFGSKPSSQSGNPVLFANNSWLMTVKNDSMIFFDEDGNNKMTAKLPEISKKYYENIIGFNNAGVWTEFFGGGEDWMGNSDSTKGYRCFNPSNNEITTYKTCPKKEMIVQQYVYDAQLYFICQASKNIWKLCLATTSPLGSHEIDKFNLSDGEISNLVVDDKYIAITVDNEYLYIYSKITLKRMDQYSLKFPDMNLYSINVRMIDLSNRRVLVRASSLLQKKLNLPEDDEWFYVIPLFERSDGNYRPGDKFIRLPHERILYYDFKHCFYNTHYSNIGRRSKGNDGQYVYTLLSGGGHGRSDQIIVSPHYLYCDYNASYDYSRLPFDFSEGTYTAYRDDGPQNPEAKYVMRDLVNE